MSVIQTVLNLSIFVRYSVVHCHLYIRCSQVVHDKESPFMCSRQECVTSLLKFPDHYNAKVRIFSPQVDVDFSTRVWSKTKWNPPGWPIEPKTEGQIQYYTIAPNYSQSAELFPERRIPEHQKADSTKNN